MTEPPELTDHHDSSPDDRATVPYVAGCATCAELHADRDPNEHPHAWLNKAATHFALAHAVKLFITKT